MKKLFLFLLTAFIAVTVNAASPLRIVYGTTSFLDTGTSACVEMDFSNTTWEKEETLKQHFQNECVHQPHVGKGTRQENRTNQIVQSPGQDDPLPIRPHQSEIPPQSSHTPHFARIVPPTTKQKG